MAREIDYSDMPKLCMVIEANGDWVIKDKIQLAQFVEESEDETYVVFDINYTKMDLSELSILCTESEYYH